MENKIAFLEDISYGSHERQKVDIFIPEKVKAKTGVILFIHGGGWTSGDKSVHHPDAEFFAKRGYISATTNYRYVSESIHINNEFDDITQALKTIKEKCAEYGFDIDKLILSGGSAGAHLALLYAYTKYDISPITPVAACCYCPPADCSKKDFLIGISGEFEDWKYDLLSKVCDKKITKETLDQESVQMVLKKISPIEYVNESCIPTAIFHGKVDELIPIEHIYDFVELLNQKGIRNEFLIFENSNHALCNDPDRSAQAKEIITNYAEIYFKEDLNC